MRVLSLVAGALLVMLPATVRAQTIWTMPTEYPESAMPGLGITTFAKRLGDLSGGKIRIQPSFDATASIRSAGMLAAIADGRTQAGDAFASTLEVEDPIFALAALPFLVTSTADAKRLADIARPFLAAALQKKGARLLYLTPWPPTGVWSKTPLNSPADLSNLKIRTYDKTSSEVFGAAGAAAASISFADTMPKLVDGSLNAVLSSGDGGAGRELWKYLPYFSEITYSLPLSVAVVNQTLYEQLPPDLREAVDAASRDTEAALWLALSTRLQENYQRMRQNQVTIDTAPSTALIAALHAGAASAQKAWCARSGAQCRQILDAFEAARR